MLTEEAMSIFNAYQGMATGAMLGRAGVSRRACIRLVSEGLLEVWWLFGFQRGVMVASRSQLGLPA